MSLPNSRKNELLQMLARAPIDSATAIRALRISQPTFSRLWSSVEEGIAMGAARARKYALRRRIPGVDSPIPLFVVSETGQALPIGVLEALQGGWFVLLAATGNEYTLFQGMPFFLRDLRPQGFLGRMEPLRNRDLDLPDDILRWSDDHVLKFLSRRSEHAAGNVLIGNESCARFLAAVRDSHADVVAAIDRPSAYPLLAERAMRGDQPGSSAGGEQPKFTLLVQRDEVKPPFVKPQFDHAIVKFSPKVDTASGQRWADLLVCEHLALRVLLSNDIPAAMTSILEAGQRVFLEVIRFDRTGSAGRLPMITLAGMDGELGMLDQNWTAVARELRHQGLLSASDQETVEILDLYGALIGNTDKHHGNIAFSWAFGAPYRLLPSYDMLPMFYRPTAHGEIMQRTWQPDMLARLELRHLSACLRMASEFWRDVLNDCRISQDFKKIAMQHLGAIDSKLR